ncbi:MAG: NADH-quinone oxidoreductase subunit NuoK [Myxococcales bacterium]|nr:NADH-quinone oxidoreductase subunit NuoK [Myxococcales bacterium]
MTVIPLGHFLLLAAMLFGIGLAGVLTRRNVLVLLMSIELMLNAVNLTLLAFARYRGWTDGHVFAFFVIAVAAAEAAVGLAMVLAVFRLKRTVFVDDLRLLKR